MNDDDGAALRVGVCAGLVITRHCWDVANRLTALTGREAELVNVPVGRADHALPGADPVAAMRSALRAGRCDVIVHCLDEVPVPDEPGLVCVTPARQTVDEALCAPSGEALDGLPRGSRVSVDTDLKAAALRALRPDLEIVMTYGTLAHRINQLHAPGAEIDAALASYADLLGIGRTELVTQVLPPDALPPAAGQGAIAIETTAAALAARPALAAAFARLDDLPTRLAVRAERALLTRLHHHAQQSGRLAGPVAAWGRVVDGHLLLGAAVIGPSDGAGEAQQWRHRGYAALPADLSDCLSPARRAQLDQVAQRLGDEVAEHLLSQQVLAQQPKARGATAQPALIQRSAG